MLVGLMFQIYERSGLLTNTSTPNKGQEYEGEFRTLQLGDLEFHNNRFEQTPADQEMSRTLRVTSQLANWQKTGLSGQPARLITLTLLRVARVLVSICQRLERGGTGRHS